MIDKHLSLLTHLLCLCFLAGCENEYFKTGSIYIQLKKPSGYADISLANIPVTLINQSIGCVYTTTTDTNGLALFELTAGICAISANQETTTGNRDYILSGSLSNIQFEANGEERSVEIPLEVSERGRLLISEIYFSGCLWPDGKNVYNKDQYLTLVNNSDDLIFLDGLCIAQAGPVSVTKPSGWMLHTDMKEIPLFMMCWEFPGTGTEYPIQPGERQTIAINAINHTNSEVGVPASLDLSSVEWAFWDPILTGSQISAGVKPLNLVWRGTGFSYLFSMNGPTILLFRPKTDLREWIANPDHIQKEPESFIQ